MRLRVRSGLQPKVSGLDDHLSNAVVILACNCEGLVDAIDLPGVRKQRREPIGMRLEQFKGLMRFVV